MRMVSLPVDAASFERFALFRHLMIAAVFAYVCFIHCTNYNSHKTGESVFDVATPKVKKALASMQAAGDGDDDADDDSFLDPAHKKL
jgi:hypothetical protein